MRVTATEALRHPFIRQDDSMLPSPRIIIDQVSCLISDSPVAVTIEYCFLQGWKKSRFL